ncbi:MAG: CRTAC1 family protein, partial [Akkermansiaceae bacterium]
EQLSGDMSLGSMAASLRELPGPQGGKIPSLSGHERNPFFVNMKGKGFHDVSLISGADSPLDGRAVVVFDYDRDGLLDIAVCNANTPKLKIYRNQLGSEGATGNFVKIRFEGANSQNSSSSSASNKNGYGSVVKGFIGGKPFRAEHRCGTGYAAQSSALMHIGLGSATQTDKLEIIWPSGKKQMIKNAPTGSIIVVEEHGSFHIKSYAK